MRITYLTILFVLILGSKMQAQSDLLFTKTGHIYFISHTDIIDIDANNNQVGSILNTKTGEIVFTLLMKSFEFKLALAYEHFNENYVESHLYPKSKFNGSILNIKTVDFSKDGIYLVDVDGDLSIHGQTKKIKTSGTISIKEGKVYAKSNFEIALADYKIEVPYLVKDRVAQKIQIQVNMTYEPYHLK